jgi:hypothetical protein
VSSLGWVRLVRACRAQAVFKFNTQRMRSVPHPVAGCQHAFQSLISGKYIGLGLTIPSMVLPVKDGAVCSCRWLELCRILRDQASSKAHAFDMHVADHGRLINQHANSQGRVFLNNLARGSDAIGARMKAGAREGPRRSSFPESTMESLSFRNVCLPRLKIADHLCCRWRIAPE